MHTYEQQTDMHYIGVYVKYNNAHYMRSIYTRLQNPDRLMCTPEITEDNCSDCYFMQKDGCLMGLEYSHKWYTTVHALCIW